MKKTNLLLAAAFSMALGSIAINASACSTVVVGKDVSATGQIMIGHNEDNDLRIVTSQYWVPAADHKAGELITYEQTTAKPKKGKTEPTPKLNGGGSSSGDDGL